MGRRQDQVLRIVQHRLFPLRRSSPEDKHDRAVLTVEHCDRGVRELLPSDPPVGVRLMGAHCQDSVQHENSLLRPLCKTSVIRDRTAQIIMELLINIHERRRDLHSLLHRKAEPVCLPVVVIGILSEDHDLHILQRSQMEGVKDILCRRKDQPCPVFMIHCLEQLLVIWLCKFTF